MPSLSDLPLCWVQVRDSGFGGMYLCASSHFPRQPLSTGCRLRLASRDPPVPTWAIAWDGADAALRCQPFLWPPAPGTCVGRRNEVRHSWSQKLVSEKCVQSSYQSRCEWRIQFLSDPVKTKGFPFKNLCGNGGHMITNRPPYMYFVLLLLLF